MRYSNDKYAVHKMNALRIDTVQNHKRCHSACATPARNYVHAPNIVCK